jgi:DNA-binding CsgD family transcriptional regulator/PAS domain-containing protein
VIDEFYQAALEPGYWPTALRQLGQAVGRSGVIVLSAYEPELGAPQLYHSFGYDLGYWQRVQEEHSTPQTNRYIRLISGARPGQVLQPRTVMTLTEWLDDPIYRKFLKPDGLGDGLAAPLYHGRGGFAALATFRGIHYEREHLRILASNLPHIRHALRVQQRLTKQANHTQQIRSALDRLRHGVILCDRRGHVLHANASAAQLLDEPAGLTIGRGGFLIASNPNDTGRLRHLIMSTEIGRQSYSTGTQQAGGAMSISRDMSAGPLSVVVAPIPAGTRPSRATVMIIVSEQEAGPQISGSSLAQLYGLTPAEARLAIQLLAGQDLPAASEALKITQNTAKTLLRRIFERTGTNRQSDLIKLVLRGPLSVLGDVRR